MVFWNCTAKGMRVEQPPTAENYAIGCTAGRYLGDGYFESNGTAVEPASLYDAQLQDRLTAMNLGGGGGAGPAPVAPPGTAGGSATAAAEALVGQPGTPPASRGQGSEGVGVAQPALAPAWGWGVELAAARGPSDGFSTPPWARQHARGDWLWEPLGIA
jgi:hypothetical protein